MSRRDLAQRYWDAYAATIEPPTGAAPRTLARIERRIAAGEPVDDHAPPSAAPPRQAAAGVVLVGKSAAASVGIATATLLSIKLAVMGWSQLTGGAPSAVEPPEPRAPAATRAGRDRDRAETPPAPPTSEPAPVPAPAAAVQDEPPAEPARRGPAPTVADRLRAEVALMDRARAALEQDDADALWRLTGEHARRFPDGALVEERRAWQAIAACRLGHADAAARVEAFLAAHPRSAQADKLRRACTSAVEKR